MWKIHPQHKMVIKYAQEIYKNISTHKAIRLVKIKSSALII